MGININGINLTNIIQIAIYITSFDFSQFPLPFLLPVLLARYLIQIPRHRRFLMRGLRLSLCERHSLRNSYHSNIEWLMYHIKLSHKITGKFLTVDKSISQQSACPSNQPEVQCSQLVCKIMTIQCRSVFLWCKKLKHEKKNK